jgi:hypothetical protein
MVKKPERVQDLSHMLQRLFLRCRQHVGKVQALQWRFGRIIDATHLFSIILFRLQFHRWLKPIDVET